MKLNRKEFINYWNIVPPFIGVPEERDYAHIEKHIISRGMINWENEKEVRFFIPNIFISEV